MKVCLHSYVMLCSNDKGSVVCVGIHVVLVEYMFCLPRRVIQ